MEYQTSTALTPELVNRSNKLYQKKLKSVRPIGHAPYYIMLFALIVLCFIALTPHFPDLIPTAIPYLLAAFGGYVITMTISKHQSVVQEEKLDKVLEVKCIFRVDTFETVTSQCHAIYPWKSVTEVVHDDATWLIVLKPLYGVIPVNAVDVSDELRAFLASKVEKLTYVLMST